MTLTLPSGFQSLGIGIILFLEEGKGIWINDCALSLLDRLGIGSPNGLGFAERVRTYLVPKGPKPASEFCFALNRAGKRPIVIHMISRSQEGEPEIAILIDLHESPRPRASTLQHLFGLTGAESKVAASIASGERLTAIAHEAQTSIATVRHQLKSIFAKTYTRRQSELVSTLLRSCLFPEMGFNKEDGTLRKRSERPSAFLSEPPPTHQPRREHDISVDKNWRRAPLNKTSARSGG